MAVVAATVWAWAPAQAQPMPAQFQGGSDHRGVIQTQGVDRLGGLAWVYETGGPVRGSPVVADGTVYVGSRDGRLYALDAETGARRWSFDAGTPVGGAPLVTEQTVVFTTRGNTIHAVDRGTGRLAWRVDTGPDLPLTWGHEGWDYLLPSPTVAGDAVLVGSGDGQLYALDLTDGTELWRFATGGRIRSSPAVHDGVTYVGSGDGIVYGVDVESGREVWRFRTAGVDMAAVDWGFDRTQIQGSPAIADDVLYIGSRDASLYAVDLASGESIWHVEDGTAWVVSTPAVGEGTVYNGRSSSGRFRARNADNGAERWVFQTGGPVFSSPAVAGGTVYFGSGDHHVYALDTENGAVRWSYATEGMVMGSPAVWHGRVYVGSDDGNVYAFRAAEGPAPRLAVFWDDSLRDRSAFGQADAHERLSEFFRDRGYEPLDSATLAPFLAARIADGIPSAVVFGMDALPTDVADPDRPRASLLRSYLDAGGKVVWAGYPPLLIERDGEGRVTGVNRERTSQLLEVDMAVWNSDLYGAEITAEGRRWGLARGFVGSPEIAAAEATSVLALDETGGASAWVRSYGGPDGTGYVSLPPTTDIQRLREMRRVVEHGIFRRAGDGAPRGGGAR